MRSKVQDRTEQDKLRQGREVKYLQDKTEQDKIRQGREVEDM